VQADGSVLTAETNTDKADMLYGTFFPKPGNEVETIPAQFQYPTPAFDYQPITDAQIRRAIDKLNSFKAPGANGIPNIVWKQCANVLLPSSVKTGNARVPEANYIPFMGPHTGG
jgi:hypothetical protein